MGLKKNKATKTSRLTCQYVGSFVVKDGDNTNLTTSQQKKIVDDKLKSCNKKLIKGMPVVLEVSPDGLKILDTDEKTVKMAHALRRISYATAETANKLFAYISHQPGTDMEVVCHTFLAKKKDHAEGLSCALGKLFKQTFAYTLKNRDKLEAAAQKRGAGRKWAKQQIVDGHDVSEHAQNAARRPRRNISNSSLPDTEPPPSPERKPPPSPERKPQATSSQAQAVTGSRARDRGPTPHQNGATAAHSQVGPTQNQSAATQAQVHAGVTEARNQFGMAVAQSEPGVTQAQIHPGQNQLGSTQNQTQAQVLGGKTQTQNPFDGVQSQFSFAQAPGKETAGQVQTGSPFSPHQRSYQEEQPPPLPRRDYAIQGHLAQASSHATWSTTGQRQEEQTLERLPSNMIATQPMQPLLKARRSSADSFTEEVSPTWLKGSSQNPYEGRRLSGDATLSGVGDNPPHLPPRKWESFEEEDAKDSVSTEVFGESESKGEQNVVTTLEDEDWYIPGVTREYVFEMLEASDMGTFFVRDSRSCPGCYALTVKVVKNPNNPSGFGNYLIMPVEDGFSLQGFDKTFPDISALIRHYAGSEDGLPCCLILAGSNPLFHDTNGYLVEFMDEEHDLYGSLSNCSSMFQELKLNGEPSIWP